jgi:hypothetical protein
MGPMFRFIFRLTLFLLGITEVNNLYRDVADGGEVTENMENATNLSATGLSSFEGE